MRRRLLYPVLLLAAALAAATPASAQREGYERAFGRGYGRRYADMPQGLQGRQAGFSFCRLVYRSAWRQAGGQGWTTDYPNGDRNFMFRMEELTTTRMSRHPNGDFAHSIVTATHEDLYRCPFLFASDVGTMELTDEEVAALQAWFSKGGFLWVDDFWGEQAWRQWESQMARVLPGLTWVELGPDHALFQTMYKIDQIPQISNLNFWRRSGGVTAERGAESPVAHIRALYDEKGRLAVLASFDTDIADGWEREADDMSFFDLFSPEAYAIASNVLVWIMTH